MVGRRALQGTSATGLRRPRLIRWGVFAFTGVSLCNPSAMALARPALQAQVSPASAELTRIFADEWAFRAKDIGRQSEEGQGGAGFLPKVDPASQARRKAMWTDFLTRLARVDRSALSESERIDAAVFKVVLDGFVSELNMRMWEMPFNSDSSFWSSLDSGEGWRKADDYLAHLAKLRQIPGYFDQQMTNMRAGLARGFSVPAVTLTGRDASIAAFITDKVDDNPLYKPFRAMPDSIAPADRERIQAEARTVITGTVVPAYTRLLRFMRDEYMPRARRTIAASAMPDGAAFYRSQVRLYTTLDLTPEEIHQIGLREVDKIALEMEGVKHKIGFTGTIAELIASLKTDPRFVAGSPDELLWRTAYITKRVDGHLGALVGRLPRERFTIHSVPAEIAPFYTSGRGGREACWMNTYDLPSRPLYALTALTLHECSPGHSLQTAIAAEQAARPDFRRAVYFSGYSEGWGLYSEWLGVGMKLYDTPYDDFGRLSYAMWRACRLVIDTGIHRYGWSREKAIVYLRERTALSDHEVETEIDRYISWPGQALSYKLGELKIRELRTRAEQQLGPRFDEAAFHDAILGLGSVPLSVLDDEIVRWIDAAGAAH